ncbi:MAG TPA: hypothetical protein VMU05_17335 [Dongiaceae bacterium]|nr:hypothetical protein [Dongiaceae bacterium]
MKRALHFVGSAAVLAILASLAMAQEVTGSLAAVKNLRVKVDMGSVVVRGGDQQAINYVLHTNYRNTSEEARRQYKVSSYVKGDTAWIVGNWQGGHMRHFGGQFEITVPRDMALVKVESGGGSVEISGISGRAEMQTGGGKIRVDDIGGSVVAETGGDSIDIGTVRGDVDLTTGGGNINVRDVKGRMKAETGGGNVYVISAGQDAVVEAGGGNVQIKQCQGRVKASTGGGNIDLGDIGGPADIETGGGSIHLASAKGRVGANTGAGTIELYGVPSARVETGAGGITLKLVNAGGEPHDSDVETGTGDITVYIAPDVAISIRASVDMGNGHRITSDFPDIHVSSEGGDWGPKTLTAEGKLNGGGPWLKVHTSTGDICLKKAGH